jgi:hypothetical protein
LPITFRYPLSVINNVTDTRFDFLPVGANLRVRPLVPHQPFIIKTMELQKAIIQLNEIHAQITKTEFYRGFRTIPVALTGITAFLAALIQPYLIAANDPPAFVRFWSLIATLNIIYISVFIVYDYQSRQTEIERQKARHVLKQFSPTLIAGALVTAMMYPIQGDILYWLPGLWSLIFSLGLFACQPYFPKNTFWLGVYYLSASSILFMQVPTHQSLHPWGMGIVFGLGQLLAATIIYRELESNHG